MISLALQEDILVARVKGATSSVFYNNISRLKKLGFAFNEEDKTWASSWSKLQVLRTLKEFDGSVAFMQPMSYLVDREMSRVGTDWESVDTTYVKSLLKPYLKIDPFEYQWKSTAYFFEHDGGILADEMGIGKTFQGILYILACLLSGKCSRFVIIPPSHLALNWMAEFKKFTDYITPVVAKGDRKKREKIYNALAQDDMFVTIIGQEVLRQKDHWDLDHIQVLHPESMVVDEAHHARNRETLLNKVLRLLDVEYSYQLTGTPFQTKAEDVFSLFEIYNPIIFGTLREFQKKYVMYQFNGKFNELMGYKNLDQMHELMSPHMMRRVRKDIGVESKMLPPQTIMVEMTRDQDKLNALFFKQLEELDASIQSLTSKKNITEDQEKQLEKLQNQYKSIFTYMQEAADCAALLDNNDHKYSATSPKLDLIFDIVEEKLECGEKVVIFTRFKRFLYMIDKKLAIFEPVLISGDTKDSDRQAAQDRFNKDPQYRVFICTDAAQEGVNLPGGSTLIHADLLWNEEAMNQRSMRIDRIDSVLDELLVIKLVSSGSIEELMLGKLAKRRAAGASIIGSFSNTRGEIS
jgi:SNF2 family DNA or RNA helicase